MSLNQYKNYISLDTLELEQNLLCIKYIGPHM
jgi:hypothetical protein